MSHMSSDQFFAAIDGCRTSASKFLCPRTEYLWGTRWVPVDWFHLGQLLDASVTPRVRLSDYGEVPPPLVTLLYLAFGGTERDRMGAVARLADIRLEAQREAESSAAYAAKYEREWYICHPTVGS